MTIEGRSIDGWPIHPDYVTPLQRVPKSRGLSIQKSPEVDSSASLYDPKPVPTGMDLVQAIIWGLEQQGIALDNERIQKIVEACVDDY